MSDLPPGWSHATIGDLLLRIEAGKSFRCEPRPASLSEWGIIKVSAMTWGAFREEENKAVPVGVDFNPYYEIKTGDILVSRANTEEYVGAPVMVGRCRRHLLLSDKSLRLVPSDYMNSRWLYYLLSSPAVRGEISRRATGTKDSMRNVSQETLASIKVQVPPLAEQDRIVATLEDHMSRLTAADQSILTGLRRARRLRQSIVDQVFNNVSGAPMERLASLLAEPLRNGHSARASDTGEGIRTLTLTAVTRGEFTDLNTKHTVADPFRVRDLWLKPGDILVERANTPALVGTSALYTGPSNWAIYPDLLIRVRVNEAATPDYVQLILSTTHLGSYFRQKAKGLAGSMPKIDQDTLLHAELPIPSIEEQDRTVASVNNHKNSINRLHGELEISRRRSGQFRRSLLTEAFAGRLLPQDPADEPASVLLESIRAERAARTRAPRRRPAALPVTRKEALL
jgi:type I restriction enzyme, S subunit